MGEYGQNRGQGMGVAASPPGQSGLRPEPASGLGHSATVPNAELLKWHRLFAGAAGVVDGVRAKFGTTPVLDRLADSLEEAVNGPLAPHKFAYGLVPAAQRNTRG